MPDCAAEISDSAPRSEQVEEVLAALKVLRGMGMELAQALVDEVKAPADEAASLTPAEAAIAFQRIAKAVRMTAALELRVLEEAGLAREGEARARSAAQARAADERRREGAAKRAGVADIMFEIIAEAGQDIDPERQRELDEDLQEWFHDERDDEDFAGMDERQMLESICEALGLVPDPRLWNEGEYVEAIAAAILGPQVAPDRPVAKAVQAARERMTRTPEPAGPP